LQPAVRHGGGREGRSRGHCTPVSRLGRTPPSSCEGHMGGKQGKKYFDGVEGGTLQTRLRPRTQAPTRRRWGPSAPRRPRLPTRCGPRTASAFILGCTARAEQPPARCIISGGASSVIGLEEKCGSSPLCSLQQAKPLPFQDASSRRCSESAAGGWIRKSGQRTSRALLEKLETPTPESSDLQKWLQAETQEPQCRRCGGRGWT